jgi:hypothetical protein
MVLTSEGLTKGNVWNAVQIMSSIYGKNRVGLSSKRVIGSPCGKDVLLCINTAIALRFLIDG